MTFIELYKQSVAEPTPRQVFIQNVAEVAGVTIKTAEHWAAGDRLPSKKRKALLAAFFHTRAEVLFP